jgi:hypothetical protein
MMLMLAIALLGLARAQREAWLRRTPVMVVELRGELDALDVDAYCGAFQAAGVERMVLVPGPRVRLPARLTANGPATPAPVVYRIVLEGRRGPNPHVPPDSRARHMLGPGYTEGDTAVVYVDELRAYLVKHHRVWMGPPSPSAPSPPPEEPGGRLWTEIWTHLVTNTAVHESWHAVTHSHSHNPVDVNSVMYANAADNTWQLGRIWLPFTRGHRDRLEEMFGPARPPQ